MIDYNQKRYFELLQSAQNLKKHGKDFYFENEKDYLELCDYQAALEDHAFWKNRHQFALLMENFINGIIDGQEFSDSFSGLHRKTFEADKAFKIDFERLKGFHPDPRSKRFGTLISFLSAECDNFEEDQNNKEFYDSIKDCFLILDYNFQKIEK